MTGPNSAEYALKVARLATLSTDEHERTRKDEAKRLGVRASVLDADVAAARKTALLAHSAPETATTIIDEFNRKYMVVNEAGRAIVYAQRQDSILGRTAYDRLAFEDLRKLHMNRRAMAATGLTDAADAWLRSPDRRQLVNGVEFNPSGTPSADGVLNLWQGFAVEPKQGGS
jgi:hypothetical protein